jgi:hypothetical protein
MSPRWLDLGAWFLRVGEPAKPKRKEMEENNKKQKTKKKPTNSDAGPANSIGPQAKWCWEPGCWNLSPRWLDLSAWFLQSGEPAKPKRKEMEENNKNQKKQKRNEKHVTLDYKISPGHKQNGAGSLDFGF